MIPPESSPDKDYLQDLIQAIKRVHSNEEALFFEVVEPKDRGMLVKAKGLFAFVSYHHWSWSYPEQDYWTHAAPKLVGARFKGKVHQVSEDPISIIIDAKHSFFEPMKLRTGAQYQGVILRKTSYGLFIELGLHFNWEYGSFLGLLHRSNLKDKTDLEDYAAGDETTVTFLGYSDQEKLVLGTDAVKAKWTTAPLQKMVGTIQPVMVTKDAAGKAEYWVAGEHRARFSVTKALYPDHKKAIRKYLNQLEEGKVVLAEVLAIDPKRACFYLKVLPEFYLSG